MKRKPLEVADIQIIPFRPRDGHLGFASCVINGQFYLGDIAIFSRPEGGIRLGFPVKKLCNGTTIDIFKPLNIETEKTIEESVLEKYESIMERNVIGKEFRNGNKEG